METLSVLQHAVAQLSHRPLIQASDRVPAVQAVIRHLNDPDAYFTAGNPQFIANIISLFARHYLQDDEQALIARKISLPMLDQGLQYQIEQPKIAYPGVTPQGKLAADTLSDTVRQIVKARRRPLRDYAGRYVQVTDGPKDSKAITVGRDAAKSRPVFY